MHREHNEMGRELFAGASATRRRMKIVGKSTKRGAIAFHSSRDRIRNFSMRNPPPPSVFILNRIPDWWPA